MSCEDPECECLPYQMEVYFEAFPALDTERLAAFINATEPGDEPCMVGSATEQNADGVRLTGFLVSQGAYHAGVLVHAAAAPAPEIIAASRLVAPLKEQLLAHQSFALITLASGDEEAPAYENLIFLLKIAMGLCDQGGIGASNPHTGLCYPGDLLLDLASFSPDDWISEEEGGEDAPQTLWDSIRREGTPMELLADIVCFEMNDTVWMATRGFAFCGFPDFVYRLENPDEDITDIAHFFQNAFVYLMANGAIIEAGHTMGYDENIAYRFSKVPEDVELPFEEYELLLVERERA